MANGNDVWIKSGYELFALYGVNGIVVEKIAKKVGVSKSSFYHHFVDTDLYIQNLLEYHISQSHVIAHKEKTAEKIDPDLIDILVDHKIDLLFNRQLRVNKSNRIYADILLKSSYIIGNSFIDLWVKDLGLQLNRRQLEILFELSLDNFYLQITVENIHQEWLSSYFKNLKRIISHFQ